MTATYRPLNYSEIRAISIALFLTFLSAFLVIRALEGRGALAIDLEEIKVAENAPMTVHHGDAAPVDCDPQTPHVQACSKKSAAQINVRNLPAR